MQGVFYEEIEAIPVRCVQTLPNNFFSLPVPVVSTNAPTDINVRTALSGGTIQDEGGFIITSQGIVWGENEDPTLENHRGIAVSATNFQDFELQIINLIEDTRYYVRAFARNAAGTAHGESYSLVTNVPIPSDPVTDIEGNGYATVNIGDQVWMAENLRVTRYPNGNNISRFMAYDNVPTNVAVYGYLYRLGSFDNDPLHNPCPEDWRMPSKGDWIVLIDYLTDISGDRKLVGGMMKSTGTEFWHPPNAGATNQSGFSGLPGGGHTGRTLKIGKSGLWLSTSFIDEPYIRNAYALDHSNAEIRLMGISPISWASIRCMRNR